MRKLSAALVNSLHAYCLTGWKSRLPSVTSSKNARQIAKSQIPIRHRDLRPFPDYTIIEIPLVYRLQ